MNIIITYIIIRFLEFFFIEGFFKPIIANFGNRTFKTIILPQLYKLTDKIVINMIGQNRKDEIVDFIKESILLIKPDLNNNQVNEIFKLWSNNFNLNSALENSIKSDN